MKFEKRCCYGFVCLLLFLGSTVWTIDKRFLFNNHWIKCVNYLGWKYWIILQYNDIWFLVQWKCFTSFIRNFLPSHSWLIMVQVLTFIKCIFSDLVKCTCPIYVTYLHVLIWRMTSVLFIFKIQIDTQMMGVYLS